MREGFSYRAKRKIEIENLTSARDSVTESKPQTVWPRGKSHSSTRQRMNMRIEENEQLGTATISRVSHRAECLSSCSDLREDTDGPGPTLVGTLQHEPIPVLSDRPCSTHAAENTVFIRSIEYHFHDSPLQKDSFTTIASDV